MADSPLDIKVPLLIIPAPDLPAPSFSISPKSVAPGEDVITDGVYVFQCPLCNKLFRYDDSYEPMCTGPSETRNDHPPEVMVLVRKEPRRPLIIL